MEMCEAHPFDSAAGVCRSCGQAFCGTCLVYAHGAKKPPYCLPCALDAAGIRKNTNRRALVR
jgi:hypothetical protein